MLHDTVIDSVLTDLIKKGRKELHNLFPRDFEVYMCALELVNPDGDPVDYFQFPIMPNSISKTEHESTTVQQSLSGVTVFNRDSFIPKEIGIQGDFGRSFKLTNFEQGEYYRGLDFSIREGYLSAADVNDENFVSRGVKELPYGVKSGFGCIKIVQSIIDKAKAHDKKGRTFRLYFYNLALGESYLVVPTRTPFTVTQNVQGSNMIWQYNMSLSIIADLNDLNTQQSKNVKEKSPFNTKNVLKHIQHQSSFDMSIRNAIVTGKL